MYPLPVTVHSVLDPGSGLNMAGRLESIQAVIVREAAYSLEELPGHPRANTWENNH